MQAVLLEIKGNWAQFRKAETNNNPLSHDLITKTAFIGMIGAVLGINRTDMKALYPILSEDILYGVQVKNDVKKQSWGFTLRNPGESWLKSPGQMEFICNPEYYIVVSITNERSKGAFEQFVSYCKEGKACYEPVLGLHNCPAEISYLEEGDLIRFESGIFETKGFVTNSHKIEEFSPMTFRLGFDKIPTYQNDDFWNLPEKFIQVIYPSNNTSLKMSGVHYQFKNQSKWCLI